MENTANIIVQYILVGGAFLGALAWVVVKMVRLHRRRGNGCCGCALSENCAKKPLRQNIRLTDSAHKSTSKPGCHEENENME